MEPFANESAYYAISHPQVEKPPQARVFERVQETYDRLPTSETSHPKSG